MTPRLLCVLGLWSGCSLAWPTSDGSDPDAVFPHPSAYGETAAPHGPESLKEDASCRLCHTVASCRSCHADYPHRWPARRAHPVVVDACGACHEAADHAAATLAPCDACHASYPHAPGFEGAGQHGVYALSRGDVEATCGSCHEVASYCTSCHTGWPHPEGFSAPAAHGIAARGAPDGCVACHEGAGAAAIAVGCADCHVAWPHPDGWVASGHLTVTDQRGEAICAGCHEPGDGPAAMPARCGASCHGGAL